MTLVERFLYPPCFISNSESNSASLYFFYIKNPLSLFLSLSLSLSLYLSLSLFARVYLFLKSICMDGVALIWDFSLSGGEFDMKHFLSHTSPTGDHPMLLFTSASK